MIVNTMTVNEMLQALDSAYPFSAQESWDNSGFQLGHGEAQLKNVLFSLDITSEVIDEAINKDCNLIITHHPLLFRPLKSVTGSSVAGKYALRLAENRISVISLHTNLDIADGGVNDTLAALLGGNKCGIMSDNLGRVAELEAAMPTEAFLALVREKLQVNALRYVCGGQLVKRYGVIGGAGAEYYEEAKALGCDALVTADVKYHQFLDARELGITLIDADHFCTETPVINTVVKLLREQFPALADSFLVSEAHRQIIEVFGE